MTTQHAADLSAYAQAIADYEALRAILPKFREAGAWLRGADPDSFSPRIKHFVAPGAHVTKGVLRDHAVCALTNKACNTHASVRTLTDSGDGDAASVLTRVILELAVVFRWMMLDSCYRLDLYCLSSLLSKRRWASVAQQFYAGNPDVVAPAQAAVTPGDLAVVEAAFGNSWHKWARERQVDGKFKDYSLERMVTDIEHHDQAVTKGFMYGVTYSMQSSHVHGDAEAMQRFKTLKQQQYFTCELGFNREGVASVIREANTYLCWLLGYVAEYLGLKEVEDELQRWFNEFASRAAGIPKADRSNIGAEPKPDP